MVTRIPLLDRLLDDDPQAQDLMPISSGKAMGILRAAVRRDLEAVLNTRRRRFPIPESGVELRESLLNYGIPDLTSGAFAFAEMRAALVRDIEATIRRFEPRLSRVSVKLVDDNFVEARVMKMKVEAVLLSEDGSQKVSFTTDLEPISRDFTVRQI